MRSHISIIVTYLKCLIYRIPRNWFRIDAPFSVSPFSEPLKDQGEDITVDSSVEIPKTKDVKTPIKLDEINEFTAQLVAMKAFFMNEVFEL